MIKRIQCAKRVARTLLLLLPAMMFVAGPAAADEAEGLPAFKFEQQTLTDATRREAARLYTLTCAACHGAKGEGNNNGLSLYAAKNQQISSAAIHYGRAQPPPLTIVMPAYGNVLTPVEIGQLAAYIATFRPAWP
ncbi:cytochrome c [Povalibacter sp.]|uniref:c-type cytochrome n=1 Tax=Povalibacter sp. TaxID=1962978 RepID=UPI002F3FAE7E